MNEELKVIISAEVAKLKQGINNAKKQIEGFKKQVDNAAKDVEKNFAKIGDGIIKAAQKMGIGISAAAGALLAVAGTTEEYRNQQAQLVTAFETAGASAETAKGVYNDLYRVLGDSGQAQEAAQHLAKITTEEKALTEWTNITQGVYATFGASLPIESLTEAANETQKTGILTGTLSDALQWAGLKEEDFQKKLDACNTEAEREQLIRGTLNGLYSEAAANYETTNAKVLAQRDAQAALQGTLGAIGEAMAPVLTAFTSFANDALAVIAPYITTLAENGLPALQTALDTVATTLGTVMGYLQENWGTVLTIAGVISGIAAAIGLYNIVAGIKAAMAAVEVTTVWGLVSAYAAQAAAMIVAIAPYVLVVAGIAAVIAIIVLCVKHWDVIKEKVAEVWAAIKEATATAIQVVVDKFTALKEQAQQKFEEIKTAISDKLTAAKEKALEMFESIKTGIKTKIDSVKSSVSTVFTNIQTTMKNKIDAAKTNVLNVFDAIKKGISDKIEAAKEVVANAVDKIKGVFNFEWSLPPIKLPHFNVSGGKAPWGFMGEGSMPRISVDWYAKGGVFDAPTLFAYGNGSIGGLGENGAEAIVPLENNLGWLDKLAGMLDARMGSNKPIVLTVDGKTFAQISIDSINQLTRQTGNLALNLV